MKKWLVGILVILVCFTAFVYFFIPNTMTISQDISVKANREGLYRNLSDEKNWSEWWPGNKTGPGSSGHYNLGYNNAVYTVKDRTTLSFIVLIQDGPEVKTELTLIAKNPDSSELHWQASIPTTFNPLKRLQIYFKANKISNDIASLLKKMKSFFSETKNVYGYDIRHELVKDSILVSTYAESKTYPSTEFIYALIDQLKKYISSNAAKETGLPMLNIYRKDSVNYTTRVAIPVDKKLPTSGNISYKWMLGGGNILVTDVQGGSFSVNSAFQQLENYVQDHQRTAPAIPFQSLVTDRSKEADTSKWITRIYYPVM
jgi:hypothetical protein